LSIVLLDARENNSNIGVIVSTFKKLFEERGEVINYFLLKDMNILPCRSCGACSFISPGKCVIKDDIHEIMRAIAKCNIYIFITPIRFGGFSSQLKKVVDRTMPLGLPLYVVRKGHMLHPMRYGHKFILAVGITEEKYSGQEENFSNLVGRNAVNMQASHRTLVLESTDDKENIENRISDLIRGVN